MSLLPMLLGDWFCVNRKGGTGGGGLVHQKVSPDAKFKLVRCTHVCLLFSFLCDLQLAVWDIIPPHTLGMAVLVGYTVETVGIMNAHPVCMGYQT